MCSGFNFKLSLKPKFSRNFGRNLGLKPTAGTTLLLHINYQVGLKPGLILNRLYN